MEQEPTSSVRRERLTVKIGRRLSERELEGMIDRAWGETAKRNA